MNFLAGDVGGTKTLLGVFTWQDGLVMLHQEAYLSKEWDSLEPIINNFLTNLPTNIKRPKKGCIAIAGPVINGSCKLTNLDWELNEEKICKAAKLDYLELINDVCVIVYGIPFFRKDQFIEIQKKLHKSSTNKRVAIIASGTGIGIAKGFTLNNQLIALPSEGGHKEFSPRSKLEWDLSQWLKSDLNLARLSIERIISGNGLGHLARWRLSKPDVSSHPLKKIAEEWRFDPQIDLPALTSQAAKDGDKTMQEVVNIWLSAYGSAAGDLALMELCQDGLWIAGGTTSKNLEGIRSKNFLESMYNKGRFSKYLRGIPVIALIDPEAGLFSAACRARMRAKQNERLN